MHPLIILSDRLESIEYIQDDQFFGAISQMCAEICERHCCVSVGGIMLSKQTIDSLLVYSLNFI